MMSEPEKRAREARAIANVSSVRFRGVACEECVRLLNSKRKVLVRRMGWHGRLLSCHKNEGVQQERSEKFLTD